VNTDLNWRSYFDIADEDKPFDEKLSDYSNIAMQRFDAERFEEFCSKHLSDLDAIAHEFFASDIVRDAIRQKVTALYPKHEIEEFTDLFWNRIQLWRESEYEA
jgi:hypothetical protein